MACRCRITVSCEVLLINVSAWTGTPMATCSKCDCRRRVFGTVASCSRAAVAQKAPCPLPRDRPGHCPRRSLAAGPWRARMADMRTASCPSPCSSPSIPKRSLTTHSVRFRSSRRRRSFSSTLTTGSHRIIRTPSAAPRVVGKGRCFHRGFPEYFDGIVAGDPVYDLEAIALSEDWGVQQIKAITPTPSGSPILYPAFPVADQQLFTRAILQACDGLDGAVDGIIDDLKTCQAHFDPATYVFSDTAQPLQCTGAKTVTCLSPGQVNAVKNINQGPRNSLGQTIEVPAGAAVHPHPDNTVMGYPYDGGFMAPAGIPSRKIGTPTSTPGDFALGLGQIPYLWLSPARPSFNPLDFDWDTDVVDLTPESPLVSYSTYLNIEKFRNRGGKIIWYHGLSDPGPSVAFTIEYYTALAKKSGGLRHAQDFSRLYLIPIWGLSVAGLRPISSIYCRRWSTGSSMALHRTRSSRRAGISPLRRQRAAGLFVPIRRKRAISVPPAAI